MVERLLCSEEPSVRYLTRRHVLGEDAVLPEVSALRDRIRQSPRVEAMLSERDAGGRIPGAVYSKWRGAHWVISALADIGYPAEDDLVKPLIDQTLESLARGAPHGDDRRSRRQDPPLRVSREQRPVVGANPRRV